MNTLDIILVIILGFGAVKGYLNGFIIEIVSLLGFILGLILALKLAVPITDFFFPDSSYHSVLAVLVFIGLFILFSVGIKIGGRILKRSIDVTILGLVDNIAGAVIGLFKWGILVSIALWILNTVGFDTERQFGTKSVIYPHIVAAGPMVFGWFGSVIPHIQDLIDSLMDGSKSQNVFLS
ncbi:MAG: CvpA family protein [Bacteroidota bacterium]